MEADIYVQADKQKCLTAGTRRPPLSPLRRFKERMLKMSPEKHVNIETLEFLNNVTHSYSLKMILILPLKPY